MHLAGAFKRGSIVLVIWAPTSWAQVTQIISLTSGGAQANEDSFDGKISADGRYVAFYSNATNLVPADTNARADVFVRDRQLALTERISVSSTGTQGDQSSGDASINADGRYVAFDSFARNLIAGDLNGARDIFVRDRQAGITELVSVGPGGTQGNDSSWRPSISADGRYVAFQSYATNLVPGDTNASPDIFVRDRQLGLTERVSVNSAGVQGDGYSYSPSISADGRYVCFESYSTNFVAGGANGAKHVFVRDRQSATTEIVSIDSNGTQGDQDSWYSAISADGRYVAFASNATNLVPGDTNGVTDVFVRDRQLGLTERMSISTGTVPGNSISYAPSISPDGRYVTFVSYADNLVPGDTNGKSDTFVRDRQLGTTTRISVATNGEQGNQDSSSATISGDGRFVAFWSFATNLYPFDGNGAQDIFVHDMHASGFASVCDPGVNGVIACPCSNPPSGPGRGCDNSAGTGGAVLGASGIAYLSMDSLVFTTSGELPTATSILLQGKQPSNVTFGQGVSCVAGLITRLFDKIAVAGGITAPEFGAGDPTVSARSATLGDPILAGQSRWYFVYYRDPVVLGGCPATSTFNATQTARIDWSL
jgi:Tol biopolymer transport system component